MLCMLYLKCKSAFLIQIMKNYMACITKQNIRSIFKFERSQFNEKNISTSYDLRNWNDNVFRMFRKWTRGYF
ncbi:hypothetical protein CNEO4_90042 [Clostridium neonatale]|nr:hypothetical protein CNEO_100085 [Clostridium neonatale]CAI3538825.1 hypothetical protein CNEO4_110106 [Clostridium neonatale]CAI3554656.1 hypothetical protein CNEO4_110107 [Clostridium neonatale]CAI3564195.1 hypothetical protein CNEO3_250043 [Clostridium neonatale]CAI3582750.1 hypothetical protein CNEO3_190025 [Clostridium neonatale]